ncbi:hypothetical protein PFISCL1PPCAC_22724, partial [Pristionchus fissidentatus]
QLFYGVFQIIPEAVKAMMDNETIRLQERRRMQAKQENKEEVSAVENPSEESSLATGIQEPTDGVIINPIDNSIQLPTEPIAEQPDVG